MSTSPVHWLMLVTLTLQLSSCLVHSEASVEYECEFKSLRLPDGTKPEHYELFLDLRDTRVNNYNGQVKINITLGSAWDRCSFPEDHPIINRLLRKKKHFGCDKKEIILNANSGISIREANYLITHIEGRKVADKLIRPRKVCRDTRNELLSIKFTREIPDNSRGQLIIDFVGQVASSDRGLYRVVRKEPITWMKKFALVTHFEPTAARRAFPCFDEPQLKATFDLSIRHSEKDMALANTHQYDSESTLFNTSGESCYEDEVTTRFFRTPKMSTYLVAFSVGQFDKLESKIMDDQVLLRVFTPLGQRENGRFALDVGRRAYALLNDYFELEQPLKKIDLIPSDMTKCAAMENWGLITFHEGMLIVDTKAKNSESSQLRLVDRAVIIAHELSHFWFGNLVTMKWWDNLWLKEAFAEWMSHMIADQIHPEYNLNIYYVQKKLLLGMDYDSVPKGNHPIKNPNLKTIEDIEGSFDAITYLKGGAVIRMLEAYVGRESFKLAIRDYMSKFKYENTDEKDLWSSVQAHTDLPVVDMMNSWLNQPGHPVVSVELSKSGESLLMTQHRFGAVKEYFNKQRWIIPVEVLVVGTDGRSETIKLTMKDRIEEMDLPDWFEATKGHWFKVNPGYQGFYRVLYGDLALKLLEKPIRSKAMSPLDRMGLIDDMRALHRIGRVHTHTLESFVGWLDHEDSAAAIWALVKLLTHLDHDKILQPKHYASLVNYYDNLKIKVELDHDEGVLERNARTSLIKFLLDTKYGPVIKEAKRLSRDHKQLLDPTLRFVVDTIRTH